METKINFQKSYIDVCRHDKESRVCPEDREGSAFNHMAGSYFGLVTLIGTLPGSRIEKVLAEYPSCYNHLFISPLFDHNGKEEITNAEYVEIIKNVKNFKNIGNYPVDSEILEKIKAGIIADVENIHCEKGQYVTCKNCKCPRPVKVV